MVISFKDILAKKEAKPVIKIKINEYKKMLKNNFLSSEWIKSCLKSEEFISHNLEKLSLKEISLFNKNKNLSKLDFMTECRKFYQENPTPDFFKLFYNDQYIIEFFENYKEYLLDETSKNANIVKLLLAEMSYKLIESSYFEVYPNNYEAYLPNQKFKIICENNEFVFFINNIDKKIILENCNIEKYNQYFEQRNNNKELIKLFLKKEECNLNEFKKNSLFLKKQYIPYNEFYLKSSKNCFLVKCQANEIVCSDKKAFSIFEKDILIYDLI